MRILLTGADGFIGTSLARKLAAAGHELLCVSRRSLNRKGFIQCDLAQPAELLRMLEQVKVDCVVNLAAVVDFSVGALKNLYSVNVLCPALIAQFCQRNNIHFIHASSVAVYGTALTRVNTGSVICPDTDYGISKSLGEQLIEAAGVEVAIIRFAGIFGANTDQHLGINRAILQAKDGLIPTLSGDGYGKRNYLYVGDASELLQTCISKRLVGTFCAAGEIVSIREMLQAICDQWLPGTTPVVTGQGKSNDHVIETSPELGRHRLFKEALKAIADEDRTNF